jgi:hypothetical protein
MLVEIFVHCDECLGWSRTKERCLRQGSYGVVMKGVKAKECLGRLRYAVPRMRTLKGREIFFEEGANSACDFGAQRIHPVAQRGREAG